MSYSKTVKRFLPKSIIVICISMFTFSCMGEGNVNNSFAVIELFTSQGCSSCPPAESLLEKTLSSAGENNQNIIALTFHVDYWDRLGWKDAFSKKEYTERQSQYATDLGLGSLYTPQMIVNGKDEFVGSSQSSLNNSLKKALSVSASITFSAVTISEANNKVNIKYTLDGEFKNCRINAALINLKEVTQIKRGENGGRSLTSVNVVREFNSSLANSTGELTLDLKSEFGSSDNIAIVLYVQSNDDNSVKGATIKNLEEKE